MPSSRENAGGAEFFVPLLNEHTEADLLAAGTGFTRFAVDWLRGGGSPGVANLVGGLAACIEAEINRRYGSAGPAILVPPVDVAGVQLSQLAEAVEVLEEIAGGIEEVQRERNEGEPYPDAGADPVKVAQIWRMPLAVLQLEIERRHQVIRSAQSPPRTV